VQLRLTMLVLRMAPDFLRLSNAIPNSSRLVYLVVVVESHCFGAGKDNWKEGLFLFCQRSSSAICAYVCHSATNDLSCVPFLGCVCICASDVCHQRACVPFRYYKWLTLCSLTIISFGMPFYQLITLTRPWTNAIRSFN
jgi:hypothetical protein